jgi:N6-L-threonylcarbamoyladenine synthase
VDGKRLDPETLEVDLVDLMASFQRAIVTALVTRVAEVHGTEGVRALALSGGVAANSELRATLADWGEAAGVPVFLPQRAFTTDNGAMIAWAGAERLALGLTDSLDTPPHARWPLSDVTARKPAAPEPAWPERSEP